MKEIFKPIEEFDGIYEISNLGNVKSLERYVEVVGVNRMRHKRLLNEKFLKHLPTRCGYLRVGFPIDNKVKYISIHRLVAIAFIPNPENKPEVNHKDGDKTNNRVDNLEWVTSSENQLHSYKNGLQKPHSNGGAKGELNSHSVLTEKDVIKIRELFSSGKFKQTELADLYEVKRSCIYSIVRFRTWKHIN